MLSQAPHLTFLVTTDLAAARAFYGEALGLAEIAREPETLVFQLQSARLRISRVDAFTPAPYTVLGWVVPDIASAVDALVGHGVVLKRFEGFGQDERGLVRFPDGAQVAWFTDPDGNLLSLTQLPVDTRV